MKYRFRYIQFRYLDLTIKVGSCDKNDIIWLREFLYPQFEVTDTPFYDCEIRVILDDKWFNSLLQKGPETETRINGFILDKEVVELVLWKSCENCQILFDDEFNVFYLVSRQKKEVSVLAHCVTSVGFRTALMRVITEYAMNYSRAHRGIFIHSSAFSHNGKGIIVAGPKNSGKTSLLIYFLQTLPSQFISNDRVLVCLNEGSPIIYGMPTVITVSENGLGMFPQFKMNLLKYNFHHRYTVDEIIARKCMPYQLEKGEYTFSAEQFCKLLGVESSSTCKLSAILFPQIDEKEGSIFLERLPKDLVLQRLEKARFAENIEEGQSFFHLNDNAYRCPGDILGYEDFACKLASQIAAYDCHLGFHTYAGNNAQDLIGKVVRASPAKS